MICTRKAVKILVLFIVFIRKKFFKNIFNIFNIQLPKSFGVGGNTKTSSSAVGLQKISFSLVDYNIINSFEIFLDPEYNNSLKVLI